MFVFSLLPNVVWDSRRVIMEFCTLGYCVGLVVRASALIVEDLWFDSLLRHGDYSGSSHASD